MSRYNSCLLYRQFRFPFHAFGVLLYHVSDRNYALCSKCSTNISPKQSHRQKTLITSDICMMFTHEPSLRGRRSEGVKRAVNSSVKVHCWDLQISHSGAVAIESRSFLCFTPAAWTVYKTFSRSKNYLLRKQTLQR